MLEQQIDSGYMMSDMKDERNVNALKSDSVEIGFGEGVQISPCESAEKKKTHCAASVQVRQQDVGSCRLYPGVAWCFPLRWKKLSTAKFEEVEVLLERRKLSTAQHQKNIRPGEAPSPLFRGEENSLPVAVVSVIRAMEKGSINAVYKCRIRGCSSLCHTLNAELEKLSVAYYLLPTAWAKLKLTTSKSLWGPSRFIAAEEINKRSNVRLCRSDVRLCSDAGS